MTTPSFTNITTDANGVQREAHGFIVNGPVPRGLPDITEAIRLMKIALAQDRIDQWVREHTPGSEPPADYYPVPEPSIDAAANWAAAEGVAGFGRGAVELAATGNGPAVDPAPVVAPHQLDRIPADIVHTVGDDGGIRGPGGALVHMGDAATAILPAGTTLVVNQQGQPTVTLPPSAPDVPAKVITSEHGFMHLVHLVEAWLRKSL